MSDVSALLLLLTKSIKTCEKNQSTGFWEKGIWWVYIIINIFLLYLLTYILILYINFFQGAQKVQIIDI